MTEQTNQSCPLAEQQCQPCRGGIEPLGGEKLKALSAQLPAGWEVVEEHHLKKKFKFADFKSALAFVNKVGQLAEQIGHHPNISFGWGKVELIVYTHKIGGLHKSDFVFAAKADKLFASGV